MNLEVKITSKAGKQVEELIKMLMADKELIVLKKIYEMSGLDHINEIEFDKLERALGMEHRLLTSILHDFENNKGWLGGGSDEGVRLTPAGIREYQSPSVDPGGGTTFQNIFHGPFQGGVQQGGSGNIQNNTFSNNPRLDENVRMLTEVIRASNLSQLDKDDFIQDVERVRQLAQQADTPGALGRAQKKLEAVKTGLEVADTGGELLGKALPYITILWQLITASGES